MDHEEFHVPESGMYAVFIELAKSFKGPLSFSVFMGMIVVMGWLSYDHVSKADMSGMKEQLKGVQAQIKSLQYTFEHNHLDTRLNSVQDKIFDVKQRITIDKNQDPVVKSLYDERMDDLNRQQVNLQHDMNLLEHQTPQ